MMKLMMKTTLGALLACAAMGPAQAAPVIGAPIVVQTSGDVTTTFLGADAQFEDEIALVGRPGVLFNNHTTPIGTTIDLGTFAAGTVLTFSLHRLDSGETFYSGPASNNFDGVAHGQADYLGLGTTKLGFEDIRGGGDHDFNDLTVHFSNAIPSGVPEPVTWLMLIAGFGGVGMAMRRQRKANDQSIALA